MITVSKNHKRSSAGAKPVTICTLAPASVVLSTSVTVRAASTVIAPMSSKYSNAAVVAVTTGAASAITPAGAMGAA